MRNPMDGGEVAYLRHAEVGVEENPGTLAALCVPGYGRVPSLCDERVQTEG